ncbi:MAG TPA: Rv3654c family TadE-like protein [Amycolatopsis sp.]|nr:Rv3654c family TadE-like protein [Amycolatopsis sp.]
MRSDDTGAATVWAAVAVATLLAVASVVFSLGSVMVTRHRAADAADLAALAAAGQADRGEAVACARARFVAERMSVRLVRCSFHNWDALVEVEAQLKAPLGGSGVATAHARAGPVPTGPTGFSRGCCRFGGAPVTTR